MYYLVTGIYFLAIATFIILIRRSIKVYDFRCNLIDTYMQTYYRLVQRASITKMVLMFWKRLDTF